MYRRIEERKRTTGKVEEASHNEDEKEADELYQLPPPDRKIPAANQPDHPEGTSRCARIPELEDARQGEHGARQYRAGRFWEVSSGLRK